MEFEFRGKTYIESKPEEGCENTCHGCAGEFDTILCINLPDCGPDAFGKVIIFKVKED